MTQSRIPRVLKRCAIVLTLAIAAFLTTPSAQARGSWEWGPAGFSAAWSHADRIAYVADYGIADPGVNYWTPFWSGSAQGSNYTGVSNTGLQNTFAVNHDINATYGLPILGYLDIVTPLFGTNQLEIAATVTTIWNAVVDTVSTIWNSITSVFTSDYTSYQNTGSYSNFGFDNGFGGSYGGYGDWGGGSWGGGGGGGGGGCFVAGTPITMADGTTRPIEQIKAGDRVLAYDVAAHSQVSSVVTGTIVHTDWKSRVSTVLINGTLRATANHPFYVNGQWRRADQLRVGDTLVKAVDVDQRRASTGARAAAGATTKVTSIESLPGVDTVFNFEVADYHDYFSGGVLVHNLIFVDCN